MMKVLHLADTHLGTRQYGLEERRRDFSRAFHQAIELAIEEGVAAVIHSGDLFDSRYPSTEDLRDALQGLIRLREAGIPFLGIVGNHEHKRGVQWLDLFASLGLAVHLGLGLDLDIDSPGSQGEPYELGGLKIYGLDYAGRQEVKLPPLQQGSVLVAHQLLDRVDPVRGELKFAELRRSGARLVLLGDYHEHRSFREEGLLVTYPGSTERWRASERGPRGCNLIDLETGRLERRLLKTRKFIYIDQGEEAGADHLLREIAAQGERLKGAVVCVYLRQVAAARAAAEDSDSSPHSRAGRDRGLIREIEEAALEGGALAVQVLQVAHRGPGVGSLDELEPPEEEPHLSVEVSELGELLAQRLGELELSPTAREIEAIIRDEKIADSNVDPEVTKLLEGRELGPSDPNGSNEYRKEP